MRKYEIEMESGKVYHIGAKAAQEAVNHVYSFCGEHDRIINVVRIGSTGNKVKCIWE